MTVHFATDGKPCDQCEGGWQEVDDYRCSIVCHACDGGIVRDYEALVYCGENNRNVLTENMELMMEVLRIPLLPNEHGLYMVKRVECSHALTFEMAMDAHDPSMEGQVDEYEKKLCPQCNGTGTRLTLVACAWIGSEYAAGINQPRTDSQSNKYNGVFSVVTVDEAGSTSEVTR